MGGRFETADGQPLALIALDQEVASPVNKAPLFLVRAPFAYRDDDLDERVDVPLGFETDLASVPWPIWWLVAPYGRHTAAAIVHDVLIGDDTPLAQRRSADALFFRALSASGTGWFRRGIMYAGVCVGGTMRKCARFRLVLFVAHLVLFWIAAVFANVAAVALLALGLAWGLAGVAERPYAWWLWYVAALAAPIVALPVALDYLAALFATALDRLGPGEPATGPWFRVPGELRPDAVTSIAPADDEPHELRRPERARAQRPPRG